MNQDAIYEEFLRKRYEERLNRAAVVISDLLPVCGFWIRQLTPRSLAEFRLAGNRVIYGVDFTADEAAEFLWRLHPAFVRPGCGLKIGALLKRIRIKRVCRKLGVDRLRKELGEFVRIQEQDAPRPISAGKCDPTEKDGAHYCIGHWLMMRDLCCMDYAEFMDTPIAILHQIYRQHLVRSGHKSELYNDSDAVLTRAISGRNRP